MCSTKMSRAQIALAALMASAGLAGCMPANSGLSPDFGVALKQNLAAQVADPDAVYDRTLEPASDGTRAAAAGDRYFRGEVKRPPAQTTSQVGVGGGGNNAAASGAGAAAGAGR